jgi:hypothetical protein
MTKRHVLCAVAVSVCLTSCVFPPTAVAARNSGTHARAAALAQLPLSFEANNGQTDSHVKFLSHGNGYTLFLTHDEAVLRLAGNPKAPTIARSAAARNHASRAVSATDVLRMKLLGTNASSPVVGGDELPGKSNYFIGKDPTNWRIGIDTFAKVSYSNIYPGIDLVYYGNEGQLENDFLIAPGADPRNIQISLMPGSSRGDKPGEQARALLDAKGDLIVGSSTSAVTLRKPIAYQMDDRGTKHFVTSEYALQELGAGKGWNISFQVSTYDRSKLLVIDPTLAYSSYLGRSGVDASNTVEVAVDSSGSAYLAGPTLSTDFPTTPGTVQPTFGGVGAADCSNTPGDCGDAVLTKINPAGTAIVYSTYLGGSDGDTAYGLAVDSAGNAYLAGSTQSSDFPITPGAFQTSINTGLGPVVCGADGNPYGAIGICADMFVAKIDPTGSHLIYSTLLGGSGSEQPQGIAVDRLGNAYVTGSTNSADFPTTVGAFQTTQPCSGSPCSNAMVTKVSADGSHLIYSTYLGNGATGAFAIVVNSAGEAYVDGWIMGVTPLDFPTTPSAFQTQQNVPQTGCFTFEPFWSTHCNDGFLTKLNATGSSLIYSTIIGGTGNEFLNGVAVDAAGDAYITGFTNSSDFPVTPGAFQTTFPASICQPDSWWGAYCSDVFVTKFDPSKSGAASLVYSTFLGGSGNQGANDVVVDSSGNALCYRRHIISRLSRGCAHPKHFCRRR